MASDTTETRSARLLGSGAGTQLFLGLLWLGITVWTTNATITNTEQDISGTIGQAAEALPGIVATTIVTGASIASAAGSRFDRALSRLLIGLIAGALFGVAVAFGLRLAYGSESSITVLAVTVGLASVVGGAFAVLPNAVLESGLWAVSWVFFAFLILGVLQPQLMKWLGGGPTADEAAQATAGTRILYLIPIAAGVFAGMHAYRSLRIEGASAFWYVVTGALPGIMLLASEGLTTFGGQSLVEVVHGFTANAAQLPDLTSWPRVRDGLLVLAAASFVSLLGGLRAIQVAKREAAEEAAKEAEEAAREAEEARREAAEEAGFR
ncbi:hypothetical protein Rhe02_23010 [Rhizocola hellebori]|uniref:Uncharacterized protein n=1 Tax=Rhizocola hellebori TaxID=1392758 RepID=A0A8J3Q6D1_9ACTN|nr:hypothetical protein [Rhizocola hellebori]GIH04234.1 hypothetical protein Rhe02_23010 [Rhizocola hellebori]